MNQLQQPSSKQNLFTRPRRAFLSTLSAILLSILSLPGCGLFYENRLDHDLFVLHSDHNEEFLNSTAEYIQQIYNGYIKLFKISPEELGKTKFFLQGQSGPDEVIDTKYSPQLLGYYLPFFNVINLDTISSWTRQPEILKQILLHEIGHHFLITQHPDASSECWFNEGLASNLEVAQFEGSHFEYPLLNPQLLKIARLAILADPDSVSLKEFLYTDWGTFHHDTKKSKHYALGWSVVYYILEYVLTSRIPLGERIRMLYTLERDELAELEPDWKAFLAHFDLTSELIRRSQILKGGKLKTSQHLTALWAIDQISVLRHLDRNRVIHALLAGFEHDDVRVRERCYLGFLKAAGRLENEEFLDPRLIRDLSKGREHLKSLVKLEQIPWKLRRAILLKCADDLLHHPSWLPVFIEALNDPNGEIRVAAAVGLCGTNTKPTMINPHFWRSESLTKRRAEAREWYQWWVTNFMGTEFGPTIAEIQKNSSLKPASVPSLESAGPKPAVLIQDKPSKALPTQ